jgi:hypothetical protein
MLIPEFEPKSSMPLPVTDGSGKLGTPCERMHLANANAPAFLLFAVTPLLLLAGLEEPQAAIATAQAAAATPIGRPRRWRLRALLSVALRNIVGSPQVRSIVSPGRFTAGRITRR